MRHSATHSLLTRQDVIIVASVSCIYSIGAPEFYEKTVLVLEEKAEITRENILAKLIAMQYERNDYDFHRATFRVKGNILDIYPAYEEKRSIKAEFFGDTLEKLYFCDPLTGQKLQEVKKAIIFPASHFVTPEPLLKNALANIKSDLESQLKKLNKENKILEAARLKQRTNFDLEFIEEMGYCKGIENYSRYFDGRKPGEPPYTLLDYFPKDFLLFIDESHVAIPQVIGMHGGDKARKTTLVEHGFRLPSALDNRPLTFTEFNERINQVIYVSATPQKYEMDLSKDAIVEQIIRPTGLIDPSIKIETATSQVEKLKIEIDKRVKIKERVLVTTLTKRMAEELTNYYDEQGLKVKYLHSDIDTLERSEIIRELRQGTFDVLIGINLLREGLDLPEVSLVAILDADKEGFLRSERSLIQTFGRAARNINGQVILFADKITDSIKKAVSETERRRKIQTEYNIKNNITPETIKKNLPQVLGSIYEKDYVEVKTNLKNKFATPENLSKEIKKLEKQMKEAAKKLDFEKAAQIRDEILMLNRDYLFL
jgi:excinuclease ABC subunit B